jgi:hypothetical protein
MIFLHHGLLLDAIFILINDDHITISHYRQQWPLQFHLEQKRLLPVIKP